MRGGIQDTAFSDLSRRVYSRRLIHPSSASHYVIPSFRPRETCLVGIYWCSRTFVDGLDSRGFFFPPCLALAAWRAFFQYHSIRPACLIRQVFHTCGVLSVFKYRTSRQREVRHGAILLCKQMERITRTSLRLYQDRRQ